MLKSMGLTVQPKCLKGRVVCGTSKGTPPPGFLSSAP